MDIYGSTKHKSRVSGFCRVNFPLGILGVWIAECQGVELCSCYLFSNSLVVGSCVGNVVLFYPSFTRCGNWILIVRQ